jgi:hypothetical protein
MQRHDAGHEANGRIWRFAMRDYHGDSVSYATRQITS